MSDALQPSAALLCKLASAVVHAEEYLSPDGHDFDREAFNAVLGDAEVQGWLKSMGDMAFIPQRRKA